MLSVVAPKGFPFIYLSESPLYRGGFVEHLCHTEVAQQSVTTIKSATIMNLVTSKAGAKNELF